MRAGGDDGAVMVVRVVWVEVVVAWPVVEVETGVEVRRGRRWRLDGEDSLVHGAIISRPASHRASEADTAALAVRGGCCLFGCDRGRKQGVRRYVHG